MHALRERLEYSKSMVDDQERQLNCSTFSQKLVATTLSKEESLSVITGPGGWVIFVPST